MDHSFWNARWAEGQIGFHLKAVNPALLQHWAAFLESLGVEPQRSLAVLVPLCGKSVDMAWLVATGHTVTGVEFVAEAAEQYFAEQGLLPEVTRNSDTHGGNTSYVHGRTRVIVADFFKVSRATLGPIDCVYDRAALVAIAPERRQAYVNTLATLLRPGGGVLLVSFEHDIGSGPPFSVPEVELLFRNVRDASGAPLFSVEQRSSRDILEQEPRFKERGASYLREVVWFARKAE
jgi:thiopurine S-methyltransferase